MRKLVAVILLVGIACISTGCFTLNYSNSASSKPISFIGEWIWYAAWGMVPITDNNIEKSLIEPRTAGGAVQNLSIKSEMTAMNWLANIFTCMVSICSKTVSVEGDVVR